MSARVTTVVLNYGDPSDTLECVRSVLWSTELDQHVLVVDNGPEGSAPHAALAAGLPAGVELVATGDNLGYAGGNNVGLRRAAASGSQFAWVLNPDLRVGPATLERLLATAGKVRDAGALGPRVVHGDRDPVQIWSDGGIFDAAGDGRTGNVNDGRLETDVPATGPRDVDYVGGACLLLRTDAIRDAGVLPEEYFLYFEETDYCRRLAARGWRLVVDTTARAEHHKRSSGELPTVAYVYYMRRNKEAFSRRHGVHVGRALRHFDAVWVRPWRAKIERLAPDWLPVFDELVDLAGRDARAGDLGRRPDLARFPAPVAPPAVAGAR